MVGISGGIDSAVACALAAKAVGPERVLGVSMPVSTNSPKDAEGKKLDFLVQEMNREANTIGSKANDITITNYMLEIKSEIEKIREQVQNVE